MSPDRSTNIIGIMAPIAVLIGFGLEKAGIDIPSEVQGAIASLLFFAACHFIGKPSSLSRANRRLLKEYLPEAPLEPSEQNQFDRDVRKES